MNQPERLTPADLDQSPVTQSLSEAGIVLQLANGTIQACNGSAEGILGFTLEQIQGHDSNDCIWQTIHEDGSPFPGETHPASVALATGQSVFGVVMGLYRPKGDLVWIQIDANPLFQAGDSTPWAAIATFRDITAQRGTTVFSTGRTQSSSSSSFPRHTLLIVEDSAEDREIYRRYLNQDAHHRYRILEAETGEDALEICQRISVDAILLDYLLPDFDGLELLQTLLTQTQNAVPILLMTGYGNEALAVQVLKAGAEDYLIKDVLVAPDLQVAVQSAIQKTELRAQLRHAQERERLVTQIAQQIRQSLELSTILETTVTKVRQLLQTDRVTIFRFNLDWSVLAVAESVGEGWRSILLESIQDPCLADTFVRRYQQGRVLAVPDIYNAELNPCHVEMLAEFQVRANLVVPIHKGNQLWGLLIAHQCDAPRLWQASEIELLQQLSTQVGTAIQQSELYRQAQTELSERQRIEAELRESELFNRKILESTSDCIKVLNLEGQILYMNPCALRELGISEFSSLKYSAWVEFWRGPVRVTVEQAIYSARSGDISSFEGFRQTFDGTPKWWEVQVSPILDMDGTVERLLVVSHDITSRKGAEIALIESSDRLRLLYETVKSLLSSTQPLTLIETIFENLRGLFSLDLYLNYIAEDDSINLDAGVARFRLASFGGITSEIAQEIECLDFDQAICDAALYERHQSIQSGFERANYREVAVISELGMTAYSSHLLIYQEQLLGTLSFGSYSRTDFTAAETEFLQALCDQIAIALERGNLINSLQAQTEQLRHANHLKDEFLAVLSHELRNPLNPILGWSQLLLQGGLDADTAKLAFETIQRNALLQSQLIEDLLDISRAIRGKMLLNAQPVHLNVVIETALETVQLAANVKQIYIKVAAENDIQVSGDMRRLQQVFWNLLSNAVKFTNPGGQIAVQLTQVESYIQVRVSDNGKGIDPAFVPYVFEYFRQQDGSTTRNFGGLGLGLAIARQIVELHGGNIWAESAGEGCGASFVVQLPALATVDTVQAQNETLSMPELSLAGVRILVVDDDEDSRNFLLFLLQAQGAQVTLASTAVQAFQILQESLQDILLTDIAMPETDGYELVRSIRASEQDQVLPVIAITAYAGELNEQQVLGAGFQCHIAKPIDSYQLIVAIRGLIRSDQSV